MVDAPITSIRTDFGDFPLVGRDLAVDGVPVGLGPRRAALDAVLVEAAVEAGAELDRRAAIRGDDEATRGFYLASEGLA
jgi:hypothetical protein